MIGLMLRVDAVVWWCGVVWWKYVTVLVQFEMLMCLVFLMLWFVFYVGKIIYRYSDVVYLEVFPLHCTTLKG